MASPMDSFIAQALDPNVAMYRNLSNGMLQQMQAETVRVQVNVALEVAKLVEAAEVAGKPKSPMLQLAERLATKMERS